MCERGGRGRRRGLRAHGRHVRVRRDYVRAILEAEFGVIGDLPNGSDSLGYGQYRTGQGTVLRKIFLPCAIAHLAGVLTLANTGGGLILNSHLKSMGCDLPAEDELSGTFLESRMIVTPATRFVDCFVFAGPIGRGVTSFGSLGSPILIFDGQLPWHRVLVGVGSPGGTNFQGAKPQ